MSNDQNGANAETLAPNEGKGADQKVMISSYTILIVITLIVGVATIVLSRIMPGVTAASLSDILTSPISGFLDGIEVSLFLLILGGCLGIVNKLGALDAGIAALVRALHGRETILIAAIMVVFAIMGSTYGFCEETIPFYALLSATLFAAGFDTMVAAATVLLGAGVGCLGSTVNPFAVGVAIDSLSSVGIEANQGIVIGLGLILTVVSYAIALFFILRYANRVRRDKGSTILSLQEQKAAEEAYGTEGGSETPEVLAFTPKRKVALALFGLSFVVMICGFIPWADFGVTVFTAGGVFDAATETWTVMPWSGLLTGNPIGEWYFNDASVWFFIMAIVIGILGGLRENEIVDGFLDGAGDMIGVALMVGLSRAISILMGETGLDVVILDSASAALAGTSALVFGPLCYLVYLGLSVVITSTSALATISMPILGPLAANLGFPPEVIIAIFCAANGLANLFSPTAVFLPGLLLARVQYPTWLKWAAIPIVVIGIASVVITTGALMVL
ncbi:YfcC family protein [Collinsella tanakaei]|uniref:YfcC family protein n=1 Tax=Collinsella tanakaei TaxID=626935 RepID=UPI00195DEE7E|nr:YfcC family protein [Collinsella tanakaei]MBM6868790.1 YfcC family protein [Collinsella tanakaei]